MKSNSSITSMKDFVFSWKSLPDKASMMNWNLHNLNHCDSLSSFHSAIQSQHQNQIGASPKDNKKNYLKLKIFTKRLSMNLEVICVIITTGKIRISHCTLDKFVPGPVRKVIPQNVRACFVKMYGDFDVFIENQHF
ncbi:CLUMA_CG003543, isoform A [Clunio marinus]|uniref:CLUMA_CG003543, isoform A n=1 Tax=Clunio marinus TaxID=568069 RepID=A0A1J1HTR1_9DIPT|nr:CLUMA_CG003543, isoform A [Clunio marinus]